jgi:hypothetical protein
MAQPGLAPDINLFEAMDIFKNFPDEELPNYRNDPKLALVAAAEMDRRLRIRKDFEAKQQKPSGPIIDQLQQQLLAPPQPMGQPMQPMAQPMAQPEMQQQGLGSLVPGMAQGGPVAFQFGGGVGAEFGGSSDDALAADEERRKRVLQEKQMQADRDRYQFLVQSGALEQAQRLREANPEAAKPPPSATPAQPTTTPAPQQGVTAEDLRKMLAGLTAAQQQPQAGMSLTQLARMAKDFIPEINPPMSSEERRRIEDEEEKRLQQKFPDKVSGIMEQLAQAAGQQVSPDEARRRAFMKAGIAGLGYQGRDFGGGLAGMLEGYQGTKESIEAANKEAKTNELKARLAGEQYKDALRRKDYESAKKYAEEQAEYKQKEIAARNQFKVGSLGIMGAVQDLMTPKKAAGATAGLPKFGDAARIRKDAVEAAQPELRDLEKRYDEESSRFHSALGFGKRGTSWRNDPKEMANFESEKENIIQKYERRLYPTVGADQGVTTLTPQMMEAIREYVKKQSGK